MTFNLGGVIKYEKGNDCNVSRDKIVRKNGQQKLKGAPVGISIVSKNFIPVNSIYALNNVHHFLNMYTTCTCSLFTDDKMLLRVVLAIKKSKKIYM